MFQFKTADCKLDLITEQLQVAFDQYEAGQRKIREANGDYAVVMNPVKLIEEMKNIKQELNQVKQLHKEIEETKISFENELSSKFDEIEKRIEEAKKLVQK